MKRKCPKCNSDKVVPIVYGYSAGDLWEREERSNYEELSKKEEFEKRKISEIERVLSLFISKIENPDSKLKKEIINILVDKVIVHLYKEGDDKRLVEIQYSFKKTGNVITKLSLKH